MQDPQDKFSKLSYTWMDSHQPTKVLTQIPEEIKPKKKKRKKTSANKVMVVMYGLGKGEHSTGFSAEDQY